MDNLTPIQARYMAYTAVVNWLLQHGVPANKINMNRPISGAGGYLTTPGAYQTMCAEVAEELRRTSGRNVRLPFKWQQAHANDPLGEFINAVAVELINAKPTALGKKAQSFADA